MKTGFTAIAAALATLGTATAAHAASDYLLELDGVKGESKSSAAVASWSFGVCNAGACSAGSTKRTIVSPRDPASGQATGKRAGSKGDVKITASQNSQSLRESPTRASTGIVAADQPSSETAKTGTPVKANWDLATGKGARAAGSGGGAGKASMSDLSATEAEAAGGVRVAVGDVDGDGRADLAFAGTQAEIESLSLNFTKIEWNYRQVCGGKHIAKATLRSAADEFVIEHAMVECTTNPDQSVSMKLTGGQMKHTKTGVESLGF